MPDLADLDPGFASHTASTAAGRVFARVGGSGPPPLHGLPETGIMRRRSLAPGAEGVEIDSGHVMAEENHFAAADGPTGFP